MFGYLFFLVTPVQKLTKSVQEFCALEPLNLRCMLAIFVISYRRKEEELETADVGILHKDAKLGALIRKRGRIARSDKNYSLISRVLGRLLFMKRRLLPTSIPIRCPNHFKKKSQNHST